MQLTDVTKQGTVNFMKVGDVGVIESLPGFTAVEDSIDEDTLPEQESYLNPMTTEGDILKNGANVGKSSVCFNLPVIDVTFGVS